MVGTLRAMEARLRVLAGACLLMTLLPGCEQPQPSVRVRSADVRLLDDEEFQKGAKRPPTARTLYSMGRLLAAQGKDTGCEFVLKRATHDYPGFLPAYGDLAALQLRQRRVDDAILTLRAGLKQAPNDPVLRNNLGLCHLLRSEYRSALEQFRQASATVPQDARYRSNLAVALGMRGRYDESLALFMQVLAPADAHHNLAILCEARNDHDRAGKERSRALALAAGRGKGVTKP